MKLLLNVLVVFWLSSCCSVYASYAELADVAASLVPQEIVMDSVMQGSDFLVDQSVSFPDMLVHLLVTSMLSGKNSSIPLVEMINGTLGR